MELADLTEPVENFVQESPKPVEEKPASKEDFIDETNEIRADFEVG